MTKSASGVKGKPRQTPSNSVFLNCSFTDEYRAIFDAALFAIYDCGFRPRCALEISDGGQNRLDKLYSIISQCNYGIHDISYMELDPDSKLPRLNMSFELGLYLGCKHFGEKHARKKTLILDKEQFRYQSALSDIAGQDIKAHEGEPPLVIENIRDWLATNSRRKTIPGADHINERYIAYQLDLTDVCSEMKLNPDKLTFSDKCNVITYWLVGND